MSTSPRLLLFVFTSTIIRLFLIVLFFRFTVASIDTSSLSDRRYFLTQTAKIGLGLWGCQFLPPILASEVIENPYRYLWLQREKEKTIIDLESTDGYRAFCYLLRDIKSGFIGQPSLKLGYTLAWIQTFFRIYAVNVPIVVTSGARPIATNQATEGAARDSLHIPDQKGLFHASDIKIPGISGEYLGRLAALAKQGGVGFYGTEGHTHIDDGRIRYWRKENNVK